MRHPDHEQLLLRVGPEIGAERAAPGILSGRAERGGKSARQADGKAETEADALAATGRKKIVVSGLWTEVCNAMFALDAMREGGYEIYMVADASGGTSMDAHKYAMDRMVQAGVVPMTWQQVLLEWQRDWARKGTYDATIAVVLEHSGAYGMGVDYAVTQVHKGPERVKHGPRIGPKPAKIS